MAEITLIKGPAGSGKTSYLQNEYQKLIDSGIRTDRILVLVRNRRQSILWRDIIRFDRAASLKIQSYFGFIQGEIKKYWPLISSKIDGFKAGMTEPVFLTSEVSQYILTRLVDEFRIKGKLLDVTASSQKIAIETLGNLSRAATSRLKTDSVGLRLLNSFEFKNSARERLYTELQELINHYKNSCMLNGHIDYELGLEFYDSYMLNDEAYMKKLTNELDYIIADGLEDAVPSEIDFINLMLDYTKAAVLAASNGDSYSRRQGACPEYVEKVIIPRCSRIIDTGTETGCSKEFDAFSEELFTRLTQSADELENIHSKKAGKPLINIHRIEAELRSEMIKKICTEIQNLLDKGFKPKDIAVICPMVDSILEYTLKSCFERKQVGVTNIARTGRYIDESFSRALITLACLCHPQWEFNPPEHDIANLIGMVLGLDPVRSSLISSEVVKLKPFSLPNLDMLEFRERIGFKNSDRYNMLKSWIEDYRANTPLSIDSFFQSAFVAIMLRVPQVEAHINSCRLLIESASSFVRAMEVYEKQDWGKAFVEMLKQGIKPAETIQDLREKLYTKDIIISTPQAYLASSMNRKIQIWTDISSPIWYRSDVEELANPYIFSPDWNQNDVWTEELDEKYRLLKCGVLLRNMLKRCADSIILAESEYNQDGYENDGILSEVLGG